MKALIFAAGMGTRLRPFTLEHPKALVPVAGTPMLERVIRKVIDAGISDIVVNVHHFASQIIDFLHDNDNFDADIHISDESDSLLDTGGGLLYARHWLDGDSPILIHNADILTDFPIGEMAEAHARSHSLATLLVDHRASSRQLLFDNSSRVLRGWVNLKTGEVLPPDLAPYAGAIPCGVSPLAFGGVHIVSPGIFPLLASAHTPGTSFPIIPFYINICADHRLSGYTPSEPYMWHDVGRPESLEVATTALTDRS